MDHALEQGPPDFLFDGPDDHPISTIVLAHGAGAPMDSPFMAALAGDLASLGHRVARFEFPYMRTRRIDGGRRPPDRAPVLLDCWRAAIAALGGGPALVIGGKSMGGRMASLVADETGARGLVCLGFPFHAAGKPPAGRIGHLAALCTPTLIIQGTRDALGRPEEVAGYALSPAIRVCWAEDGDHSLVPRKSSGRDGRQSWRDAAAEIGRFAVLLPPATP